MSRARAQLERNTFVRGIITEASPLTFPENASIDERNFVLNRDGSRQRRFGMDAETSNVYTSTGKTSAVFDSHFVKTFKWDNVGNDPVVSLGVIQIGNDLWFVDLFATTLSTNIKNGGAAFSLNTASIGYNISGNTPIEFASIDGKLVLASQELRTPLLIEYDSSGDSFTVEAIEVKVRDLWGVEDGLEPDERPSSLSTLHDYNLRNQGWVTRNVLGWSNNWAWPRDHYKTQIGVYPANNSQWHTGMAFRDNSYRFYYQWLDRIAWGNTPAPRGHYVIDAFDRGASRSTESGLSMGTETENGRLSVVAAYAGRIFYSGIESNITGGDNLSPNYSGTVFFTQIIQNKDQFGKCYQEFDPTAEDFNDLLDTDGGYIKIPEAGRVLKLVRKGASLIVVCDNGVWEITGPDSVFKATDYSITQITDVGCISGSSVVVAESIIMYWADGGIYLLQPDQVSGRLSGLNMIESTIQTLYSEIPSVGRANAVGHIDNAARKISWLFNDTDEYDGISLRNTYNRELIYDTVLQAWYTHEINDAATDSPMVAAYLDTQQFNTSTVQEPVVHNGDQVQVNGVDVVVSTTYRSRGVSQTKYLTIKPNVSGSNYGFGFAQYNNISFLDWNEVDAAAYLTTGHEIFQDTQRRKMVPYLTMHFLRTETGFTDPGDGNLTVDGESSCLVQARWDFANSTASGKWGTQFQAYRLRRPYFPTGEADTFDYGWEVITSKSRLRGSGKALSLRIDTEAGKDLYILGWGMQVDGETNV